MQALDGASVSFSCVGAGVTECQRRQADIKLSLSGRREVIEDVFMSNNEATKLAEKLLFVVSENKKKGD